MIRVVPCLLAVSLMATGCAWFQTNKTPAANNSGQEFSPLANSANGTNAAGTKLIITPDASPSGRVKSVNPTARFAVLNFPIGNMPPVGLKLYVYRQGLKVGEVKVTGPTDSNNTVADIVNGEAQAGDEIRAK